MRRLFRPLSAPLRGLLMAISLWLAASSSFAIDIVVTRYDDPVPNGCTNASFPANWDCSLREAVIASRTMATDDRIFLSAGVYELTLVGAHDDAGLTGDLDIRGNLEIVGAGATMTTIDGNGNDRIFHLTDEAPDGNESVTISGVAITGGVALDTDVGPAIFVSRVDLTLDACELFGNGEGPSDGGAIYLSLFSNLALHDTTIHDNLSGGVHVNQSDGQFFNSTFSSNESYEIAVGSGGYLLCQHCTVRDVGESSQIVANGTGTLVHLANSAVIGGCNESSGATIQSLGGNLESPAATCNLAESEHENVASHGFGSLLDNGGPTPTHFPSLASPAVGSAASTFCTPTDQRGVERTDEESCEIGSVERATVRPLTPIFHDGFLQGSSDAWSSTLGG